MDDADRANTFVSIHAPVKARLASAATHVLFWTVSIHAPVKARRGI